MNGVIKVFEKIAYVLSILIGIVIANSCTCFYQDQTTEQNLTDEEIVLQTKTSSKDIPDYGSYLAGRMAHIRHDLNTAADYYKKVVEDVPDKQMLPSQLYIMLTSQGRIKEAVQYAQLARQKGDESPFIYMIEAVDLTKDGNYQKAIDTIKLSKNPMADSFFNPLIAAWNYAGLKEDKKALKALSPLASNPAFKPLYLFHAGAINDYLGNNKAAEAYYTSLMNIKHMELSVFPLQVIANFYLRQNEPDKALRAASLAINKNNLMMKNVIETIKKSDTEISPLLDAPEKGLADALFSVALLLQQDGGNADLSILFASLASYCYPQYPLPYLLTASLLEKRELFDEANRIYTNIKPDSYAYYNAQFQIGKNLIQMGQIKDAESIFRKLYASYPPNTDILTNLGEVSRINGQYLEAAKFYQKAVDCYPETSVAEVWPLYFAIGVSYSAANNNELAEKYLRKVLQLKPNRLTQNHLGYILLIQNKNIEEAFELIVSAYNPRNDDGTVTDSLGWAFFKIGDYEQAVKYLEKASDQAPSEAVIYDHLGDAYWMNGRQREAVFQWNHALGLKDDTGEFDRNATLNKLENGIKTPIIPAFDKEKINQQIDRLRKKENK